MRQAAALLEPVVDVRDVLESYLRDHVLVVEWQDTLRGASNRFKELGAGWSDQGIITLGEQVQALANTGLAAEPDLTEAIARAVERLLEDTRAPGIPRPEDDDWGF
jgi:hypothetical protein